MLRKRTLKRRVGHHSRQAIGERIDHLYNQESLPALAEVGLKPAPSVLDASSSAPKPPTDTNSTPYAPSIPASTNQHQGIIHPTPGDVAAHPPPPFGPFGGRPTRQQGHPTPQGLYNTFGYPAPLRPDIDPFTGLPRTRLDDLELPPPVEEQMRRAQAVNMARRELRDHDAARTRLVARLAEAERDAAEFDETEEHRKRGGDRQEREREE